MVRHSTLTGADLHDPKGKSPTPLDLAAATTAAYEIRNSFGTDVFAIDTIGGNSRIRFGTETPLNFAASTTDYSASAGTINLYGKDSSGVIQLFARDSAGTITQLTPAGAGLTGATNLSWTINSDATTTNEDPYITLLGGDGAEIVATIIRQDSSADAVYIWQQLSSVADDTADRSSTVVIGPMTSVSSTGIDSDATLMLRGHLATNGVSVFKEATIAIDASTNIMRFTTPSGGTYTFATGDLTFTGDVTIDTATPTITVAGSSRSLTFQGANTTTQAADFFFNTGGAHNGNSFIFEVQNNSTSRFKINYAGGIDIIQGTPQGGFTAQPMIRCTGAAATTQTASTEIIDFDLNAQRTLSFFTGAIATMRCFRLLAPTYAFSGASTITDAATFYVDAAPVAGTNATITNAYSVWVAGGRQRHVIPSVATAYLITDGSNSYVNISGASGGTIALGFVGCSHTWAGDQFDFSPDSGVGIKVLRSDTSTAYALSLANASTGDATIAFDVTGGGGEVWTLGVDNSDSDAFKLAESTTLGSTDRFVIEHDAGPMRFRSHTSGSAGEDVYTETVRVTVANDTFTTIWSSVIDERYVAMLEANVIAQSDSGTHESAWYVVAGGARRYSAGNVTQIGSSTILASGEEDAAWDVQVNVDTGTQTLRLQVKGNDSDNTTFTATIRYRRHIV